MATALEASSPQRLFDLIRRQPGEIEEVAQAITEAVRGPRKAAFVQPAIAFLEKEDRDEVRSWATNVLELAGGGEEAQKALLFQLDERDPKEMKRTYRHTRFFALRALTRITGQDPTPRGPPPKDARRTKHLKLLQRIYADQDEDWLVRCEAAALLALDGDGVARDWLGDMLGRFREGHEDTRAYWAPLRALRALREFPVPELAADVIAVRDSAYTDHLYQAVRTLGGYRGQPEVVRALGDVAVRHRNRYLRLLAVQALAQLRDRDAEKDLFRALGDTDAEVRVQAAYALRDCLSLREAIAGVVHQGVKDGATGRATAPYVEALRRIDPDDDRALSTETLSKELASDDRKRAEAAQGMLIQLGGWAAMQRLTQRKSTLDALDEQLAKSEDAVKATFEDTIRQARRNFYFAMLVNVLVVVVGIALITLAMAQLVANPARLEGWVLPGGTGVLGVIVSMYFNNPRKNAREDLAALLNVNVLFLGYLRQLNEIDATFKHAYLESQEFSAADMERTVRQIEEAVSKTLAHAHRNLRSAEEWPRPRGEPAPQNGHRAGDTGALDPNRVLPAAGPGRSGAAAARKG